MYPIINQAKRKSLDLEDLPNVMKCDAAAEALLKIEKEVKKPDATLSKMLYHAYASDFAAAGVVKLGHDVLQYTQVVLIGLLIQFIENGGTDKIVIGSNTFIIVTYGMNATTASTPAGSPTPAGSTSTSTSTSTKGDLVILTGYVFAVLLFLCQVVQNCFLNAYFHRVYRVGLQARSFVVAAIYRKSLRVSMNSGQRGSSTGSVVNLMSNDAARVTRLSSYGHNLWSSPFQICVAFVMLMLYIGPSAIVGLIVMALSVPMKKHLAKKLEQLRQSVIVVTDSRVRLINDVLQGIQIIKLYAWEKSFLKQILNVRAKEMKLMHREITLGALNRTAWNLTPLFVTLATFAVYAYTGGEMKASKIFTALSLFRRVRFPLSVFPQMITNLIDFFVASKRITTFLNQKEVGGLISVRSGGGEGGGEGGAPHVTMTNATFRWHHNSAAVKKEEDLEDQEDQEDQETKKERKEETEITAEQEEKDNQDEKRDKEESKEREAFHLDNVNLNCKSGELVMIVGKVGAGKSSLLSAMLGEMELTNGMTELSGSVSYVPQQSWILNATLRENVIMGMEFDHDKYQDALSISSLVTDIGILPRGDQTEIGEKGITLSGGQKQRVSLARAVYSNREICLLDDPLSALDVHVGRECFEQLICGRLKDRLAILVTHDWYLLKYADRIIFVDGGGGSGVISGESVKEMKEKSVQFRELMISVEESGSNSNGGGGGGGGGGDSNGGDTTTLDLELEEVVVASVTPPTVSSDIVVVNADNNQDNIQDNIQDNNQDKNKQSEKLTLAEVRQRGSVKSETISHYFSLFFHWTSSWSTVVLILTLMGCAEACNILTNWWLAQWSVFSERGEAPPETFPFWIGIYGVFVLGSLLLYFLSQLMLSIGAVAAATRLHDGLLHSLLGAPMSWFERTPTGRTLSRASKDVDEADTLLRQSLGSMFSCLCETAGVLVLVSVITKGWMAIALVPVIGCYYVVLQYYRHCSRELKRIESTTKSPIFSHFAETLNGLECLRAFELEQTFLNKHVLSLDTNHRAFFLTNAANRWVRIFVVDFCC